MRKVQGAIGGRKLQEVKLTSIGRLKSRRTSCNSLKSRLRLFELTSKGQGLTWSWKSFGQGSKSWNSSIEDSIRRIRVGFPLKIGEVLALGDHLYLVSFVSLFFVNFGMFYAGAIYLISFHISNHIRIKINCR